MSKFISQINPFNKENYTWEDNQEANSIEAGDQFATEVDQGSKRIGTLSAVGLIANRMLGTGVFAVSSTIYTLSNSIGLSLFLWVFGYLISLAGLFVYMEFGSALPRNGGEKNYLEYVFKKPKFLISCLYGSYAFFLGWAASNSTAVAEFWLAAAGVEVTKWNQRGLAIGVVTFCFLVNAVNVKAGLYLQNALGIFKVGIVLFISVTGWVALGGGLKHGYKTDNFHNAFGGASDATAYGVVNALYNVIWSFIGYSNINYALGEVKNPVRTLKIAAPAGISILAVIYIFVNIAYYAVVPKEKLISSKLILVGDFFDIAFGGNAKTASLVFVSLSALGNVLSVIFAQGRIIQQLGREGVLPFSDFFATSRPFNSPGAGLFQHWIICVVTLLIFNSTDAYNFILNLIAYPLNIVNFVVASGLLYLNYQALKGRIEWAPKLRATIPVIIFFMLANLYLIIAPYVPPSHGQSVYQHLPYYLHCVVAWGIFAFGGLYWLLCFRLIPKWRGYELVYTEVIGEDGFWRNKIVKKYHNEITPEHSDESSNIGAEKTNDERVITTEIN